MTKDKSGRSKIRNWFNNIPVEGPVNRQMAFLLQVMLVGIISIQLIAMTVNLTLAPETTSRLETITRSSIFIFISAIPFVLLRYGYFRASVAIIIGFFFFLIGSAIFTVTLRELAENLTFFTLAILLAGLLIGRRALYVTFLLSTILVIISALRIQDPDIRLDNIAVAGNFILLNGLMSVFISYFGATLRNALRSSLQREEELKREVTHRKQAEEQVHLLNQQLQKQLGELERFTYTVSHDLRNPLVTIKGFLGMLNRDIEKNNREKIQSDFDRIAGATDKMDTLLSDLLELSRVGRVINPPVEFDTVQLIEEAIEIVDARLRSMNVKVNILPGLPMLYGDRIRILEVFENLVDNAAKYMADQPEPLIEIGLRNKSDEQVIFVRDNGRGIEEAYKDKIFGLFEKLDPTIEGTGVGLALVKRIIETHGGRIWVESDGLGKGSTFCFTIPDNRV